MGWWNKLAREHKKNKVIKYINVRIEMLREELKKNPSEENTLIINHSIGELTMVLQMMKRNENNV